MSKHTPRGQRLAWVSAWRESGETVRGFTAQRGLHHRTFRSWVAAARADERGTDFLEVQLPAVTAAPLWRSFAVRVDGLDFVFDDLPPPDWFAAVLRGVGRC